MTGEVTDECHVACTVRIVSKWVVGALSTARVRAA